MVRQVEAERMRSETSVPGAESRGGSEDVLDLQMESLDWKAVGGHCCR